MLTCQDCNTPLEYKGRGRKPKRCPACKRASKALKQRAYMERCKRPGHEAPEERVGPPENEAVPISWGEAIKDEMEPRAGPPRFDDEGSKSN